MSSKKEKILDCALELFGTVGYTATSTSKIAKAAGVSEGLIFRHFKNKQGLLDAIIADATERTSRLFGPILLASKPEVVIRKTIMLPFSIEESEFNFWRLQFKLKWEIQHYKTTKMKPLLDKLEWAFSELNYEQPALEAKKMNYLLDSISSDILKGTVQGADQFEQFLLNQYKV